MRALFFLIAVLLVAAPSFGGHPFGDPVFLGVEESLQIGNDDLTVGFVGILSDSRCPEGVYCFWPGDAETSLWLQVPGGDRIDFILHTYYDWESTFTCGPFIVSLDQVAPYPVYGQPIDPADYVVTLTVASGLVVDDSRPWAAIKALYR